MARREESRQRVFHREAARRQKRATTVLKKLVEQERAWQYMQGAVIMIQAFVRGMLARMTLKGMQHVRMQGKLCAHQAAWKAKQRVKERLMERGLVELAKVQRRLHLARNEQLALPYIPL